MAHHASGDRDAERWLDLIPEQRRHEYSLAEIKRWLEVFVVRFFQDQPAQTHGDPERAQGRLGRLAVTARRLARAQRCLRDRLAGGTAQ